MRRCLIADVAASAASAYTRMMRLTPGLLFAGIMLPLLALCYYCGVLPSKAGVLRKRVNPRQFNIGAAIYLAALLLAALVWR